MASVDIEYFSKRFTDNILFVLLVILALLVTSGALSKPFYGSVKALTALGRLGKSGIM